MASLRSEIEKRESAFVARIASIADPNVHVQFLREISAGKNGVLALSGALVLFGRDDGTTPIDVEWYRSSWPDRASYEVLRESDFVFGCDVFGDLLVARDGALFRLHGEDGAVSEVATSVEAFLSLDIEAAAEMFGGGVARDRFARRVIGRDPLRLMPPTPFGVAGGTYAPLREIRLTALLSKKARLCRALRGVPDGATVDASFWLEDSP